MPIKKVHRVGYAGENSGGNFGGVGGRSTPHLS